MPIPTDSDRRRGHCSTLADGILTQLKIIEHANMKDRPRLRRELVERINAFGEACIEAAELAGE
jgi:hypothetical protein